MPSFFPINRAGIVMLSSKDLLANQLNIAAQNLSNTDNVGFKGYVQTGIESVYTNTKMGTKGESISYVVGGPVRRDTSQGALKQTNYAYDFAISGSGYFMVMVDGAKQYTRDGRFHVNKDGVLSTVDDHAVLSDSGSTIDLKNVERFLVEQDGTIITYVNGIQTVAGQLGKASFNNEQDLQYVGFGRFLSDQEAVPSHSKIMQGFLEQSNVNAVEQSIKLMMVMRRYEEAQRMMDMDDSIRRDTLNMKIA